MDQLMLGIEPPAKAAPPLPSAPRRQPATKKARKGIDKPALVAEARGIVTAYHDAALACDRRRMVGVVAMFNDVATEWNGSSCGVHQAAETILQQFAAPDGAVPMHGQAGKFVLTIAGARCALEYRGLAGSAVDVEALDFGKPWLSDRGGLSAYQGAGACDMTFRVAGEGVAEFVRRLILARLGVESESEIRLVEMRFRMTTFSSDQGTQNIDEPRRRPARSWHKDWQPGGIWHGLATGMEA